MLEEPNIHVGASGLSPEVLLDTLVARGVTRRAFMKYAGVLAATLALPLGFVDDVARALASVRRPRLVWLQFQDCTGDSESALRGHDPDIGEVILKLISWDYHELLMAASGEQAQAVLAATVADGGYLAVVEGSVLRLEGACTIAGKSARQHLLDVAANAVAIVNVGTCSAYGGIPRAAPDPTGALPTSAFVSGVPQINLPGCPVNAVTITATLVHYLTFGRLPDCDDRGRPLFAYAKRIHDTCERRKFFDAGMFAEKWGDEGHRKGYCLYRLGCKGPYTWNSCALVRWNQATSWPIGAGHPCFGCSEPRFWDTMEPFYGRLPEVSAFGVEVDPTAFGVGLVAGTAGAFALHGVGKSIQHRARERRAGPQGSPPPEPGAGTPATEEPAPLDASAADMPVESEEES